MGKAGQASVGGGVGWWLRPAMKNSVVTSVVIKNEGPQLCWGRTRDARYRQVALTSDVMMPTRCKKPVVATG